MSEINKVDVIVIGAGVIGLAIAKNAISAHDGTLTLENQEHGGLCVNIRLPFKSE